jgi:hypothetical protein
MAKWRRQGYLLEQDRQRLMINLNQMRMVCDSTYILDQKSRHDTKIDELMYILEEALADEELKVVVFSQWERMTRLVARELEEMGVDFAYLHGGVLVPRRVGSNAGRRAKNPGIGERLGAKRRTKRPNVSENSGGKRTVGDAGAATTGRFVAQMK